MRWRGTLRSSRAVEGLMIWTMSWIMMMMMTMERFCGWWRLARADIMLTMTTMMKRRQKTRRRAVAATIATGAACGVAATTAQTC